MENEETSEVKSGVTVFASTEELVVAAEGDMLGRNKKKKKGKREETEMAAASGGDQLPTRPERRRTAGQEARVMLGQIAAAEQQQPT